MAKKNVSIEFLVNMTNDICKKSAADCNEIRQGAINLLEIALYATGNYKGFSYLVEVADGNPGVRYKDGQILDYPARFLNTDPTRVKYFY